MHCCAQGASAFTVDDAHFEYITIAASFELGRDQLWQIARVESVQVEFAGDGDFDRIIAGIGRIILRGHDCVTARLIVGRFGRGLVGLLIDHRLIGRSHCGDGCGWQCCLGLRRLVVQRALKFFFDPAGRFFDFSHGLAETAGKLGEFFAAEKDQHDHHDHKEFGAADAFDKCEGVGVRCDHAR